MAKGINKVILIGHLGADPEVRYLPAGSAVTNLNIATTDNWKDKEGNQQDRTEWHRVVYFAKLAEIAGEYLKKGAKVYVEGRLQTRKWQDKNGQERYTTEIIGSEMQMLDSKQANNTGELTLNKKPAVRAMPAQKQAPVPNDFTDDDCPF